MPQLAQRIRLGLRQRCPQCSTVVVVDRARQSTFGHQRRQHFILTRQDVRSVIAACDDARQFRPDRFLGAEHFGQCCPIPDTGIPLCDGIAQRSGNFVKGEVRIDHDPIFIEKLDPIAVENYLIDLKSKEIIATLGTQHYAVKNFVKNRGAIFASWRKDSKALLVEEPARFGSAHVVLIELSESGQSFSRDLDVVPLTIAMKREALAKMLKQHPTEEETIRGFSISFSSIKWIGGRKFKAKVIGEIPKDPEPFLYDKEMTFHLPEWTVKVD